MRAVIFTAYIKGDVRAFYVQNEGDLILCADGGYRFAKDAGIEPHVILGDCDSMEAAHMPYEKLIRAPKEKDDTDTMLAIRYAIDQGASEALVLGGLGGRFDHTFANVQSLAFAHMHGVRASLIDGKNRVYLLENESITLTREPNMSLSLFAFSEVCKGVCVKGVQYPLENARLSQSFPLGVSNAFVSEEASVCVKQGILLLILSRLL